MVTVQDLLTVPPDLLRREAAKKDLISFAKYTMPGYQVSPHHRLIADKLMDIEAGRIRRLIITMPPRHGKSELASIKFPAWFLGRHPDHRIIACGYSQTIADRSSRLARNHVNDDRWPFPVKLSKDSSSKTVWDLDSGGGYIAAGVGGSITGYGADVLLIDDYCKSAEEADSQLHRDRTWEWYQDTAYPRLHAGGAVVIVSTRWHEDDLIGRILASDSEQWEILRLPALAEDDDPLGRDPGAALWPDKYPVEELSLRQQTMSSRMWLAQYQARPTAIEGSLFKRSWWVPYTTLPEMKQVALFIDSAFKTGVANDYTAVGLWGLGVDDKCYLINSWKRKVEFPDLISLGYELHAYATRQFPEHSIPLVVEDKASGQSAIQQWKRPLAGQKALPVITHVLPAQTSKVGRAEAVTPYIEGGLVAIPASAPWLEDWLDEMTRFPLAAHDDVVDVACMAISRFLKRTRGGVI